MRPDLVSWRPGGAPSSSAGKAPGRAPVWNYLTLTAALLALGLLIGFYWVVSSLVQRAETGREQARLTVRPEDRSKERRLSSHITEVILRYIDSQWTRSLTPSTSRGPNADCGCLHSRRCSTAASECQRR